MVEVAFCDASKKCATVPKMTIGRIVRNANLLRDRPERYGVVATAVEKRRRG